ncbi:MAG: GTP-binding protein EngB [Candidatus Thorarchaeota archaeon]
MRGRDHIGADTKKPMIVFAGRSNVGKSSTIRALTGKKVRVGKRPGSTRWEQFIDLGPVVLVDIPGFGYMAGQSKAAIDETKTSIIQKLESWSERLALVVLIIDISLFEQLVERWEKRGEIPVDIEFYDFLSDIAPHVIVVANKIDKLKPREKDKALEFLRMKMEEAVPGMPVDIIVTTASKRVGTSTLAKSIERVLAEQDLQRPHW